MNLFRDILETRQKRIQEEIIALQRRIDGPKGELVRLDGSVEKQPRQLGLEAVTMQKQIETLKNEFDQIALSWDALKTVKDIPFVWDIAFVEIFEGDKEGFDIVIGNPPYVRQENIADPHLSREEITTENKKIYKAKLARSVYQSYPKFFGYNRDRDAASRKLDAKSDLYIYFYFHGLSLLNKRGSFCFITSNSWLDVGYGKDLQEFLLKHCHVKMIIDNQLKRSFASADVNTIIALFSAPDDRIDWASDKTAKFIMFKVPFESVLSAVVFDEIEEIREQKNMPEYKVYPIRQELLLIDGCEVDEEDERGAWGVGQRVKDGITENIIDVVKDKKSSGILIKSAKYIGNKWGGKYLRAPDIYWTILEKGKGKLVRLGDIAEVRFGIKTGANEFFYLDEEKIKQWGIEEEFLKPVIKSPRECKRILIDPKDLKYKIFMCHKDKKDLKGTAALEYIKWGEGQGFHVRPSCAGRARWWDVGTWEYTSILWVETMFEAYRVYRNVGKVYESDKFYGINIKKVPDELCAILNSSVTLLQKLLSGFASLGEGALKTPVYEVKRFLILKSSLDSSNLHKEFFSREIKTIKEETKCNDRCVLDTIIFDVLDLTQTERDAVYEAVINLVESRLKKAGSV
ncbi:MAG: Modification methylase Eco57IB [Deltaproteobacteria bacterium ADurb.Bin135]|nr:MAG: Modification methylase Eco57IB [Deltaproteobacteria bacterium ADurb.Bin135]